jgi:hypothetical protein
MPPTCPSRLRTPRGRAHFSTGRGPYVCRTQGLPLRWLEDLGDDVVEMRDICPLNEPGTPIEELDPADCWTIGPYEDRLQAIARAFEPGMGRVRLRGLFRAAG